MAGLLDLTGHQLLAYVEMLAIPTTDVEGPAVLRPDMSADWAYKNTGTGPLEVRADEVGDPVIVEPGARLAWKAAGGER